MQTHLVKRHYLGISSVADTKMIFPPLCIFSISQNDRGYNAIVYSTVKEKTK